MYVTSAGFAWRIDFALRKLKRVVQCSGDSSRKTADTYSSRCSSCAVRSGRAVTPAEEHESEPKKVWWCIPVSPMPDRLTPGAGFRELRPRDALQLSIKDNPTERPAHTRQDEPLRPQMVA